MANPTSEQAKKEMSALIAKRGEAKSKQTAIEKQLAALNRDVSIPAGERSIKKIHWSKQYDDLTLKIDRFDDKIDALKKFI